MAKTITVALKLDTKQFDSSLKKAKSGVKDLNTEFKNGSSASKGFQMSVGKVAAGLAAVAGAAMGLKNSIAAAQSIENLGITLSTLYGDANKAAEAMQIVQDAAGGLTQELQDIQSGVPSLALIEEKFGGLDNAIQYTAGVASAFGMSFQEAAVNVQKSMTAGIGAADMFRDKGVKAFLGFEEGVKYSAAETQKLMLTAFDKMTQANESAADTMTGRFSMVKDAVFQVSAAFGTAFGDTLKDLSSDMSGYFTQNKDEILAMASALGEMFGKALTLVTDNAKILVAVLAGAFGAMAVGRIVAVVSAIGSMVTAIRSAATAAAIFQGVTGIGLLKVGAGLAAATASIVVMNGMFDENAEAAAANADANVDASEKKTEATEKEIALQAALNEAEKTIAAERKERDQKELDAAAKKLEQAEAIEKKAKDRHAKQLLRGQELFEQAQIKLEYDLKDIEMEAQKIGLSDIEIEQLETKNNLNREREEGLAKIAALQIKDEEKNELMKKLNDLYDEQIEKITETQAATAEQQKSFSAGWSSAWQQYQDDANDHSKAAHDLFTTFSGGMEDAFVKFIETGKLSFKDLIDDMLKAIVKFMAKQAVMKFLGLIGGAIGGPIGALLTGFSASQGGGNDSGGIIGPGSIGLVGEKGPELIKGPAQVIGRQQTNDIFAGGGMGGGVTYNIVANDALSFKQMIMRDPEFIYNATVAGSRRLPQ